MTLRPPWNAKKLSPRLLTELEVGQGDASLPIIVCCRDEEHRARLLAKGVEAAHRFKLLPFVALEARPDQVAALSRRREILMIWRDRVVHTCLDVSVPVIGAPRVWESGYTGRDIKVAIIDTGVDIRHPDLANRVIATKDVTGEAFADVNGHGTHVAGIIAGKGRPYTGVAKDALLLVAKVLRGDGLGLMSWVMMGVEWAVENGAQVINLSLGASGACDGSDALSTLCDAAADRGVVICAAAGNDGPRAGTVGSPGCARKVITVGASTDQDQVTDFSSRGPTADGRPKPDVLFPGYGIISTRARNTKLGRAIDDLYTEASGTSMATPHASGTAALLLEARPGIRPVQLKRLLMLTAKTLRQPANAQGAGRAQVYEAYQRSLQGLPPEPPEVPPPPIPGRPGCLPAIPRRLIA